MRKVFVRADMNYDMEAASLESALKCEDESLTQQHQAEETDINVIVRKFGLTGQMPQGVVVPTFGDFENISDFKTAVDLVAVAHEAFDAMDANVRSRFHNNPQEFLDFVHDDNNRDEAIRLGLVPPPPPPVAAAPASPAAPVSFVAASSPPAVVSSGS